MTPNEDNVYRMPLSPRWGDLDAMNHVNNATYLRYLEEARIQWLEAQDTPWHDDESAPVLASATVNYRLPIGYPSRLSIELTTTRIGHSSLTVAHRIVDAEAGTLHCDGQVVVVWIERASGRPAPLPEGIRRAAEKIARPE